MGVGGGGCCWSKREVLGKRVRFEKVGMVILTIEIMEK